MSVYCYGARSFAWILLVTLTAQAWFSPDVLLMWSFLFSQS